MCTLASLNSDIYLSESDGLAQDLVSTSQLDDNMGP